MELLVLSLFLGAIVALTHVHGTPLPDEKCEVRARTEAGWVCGARRYDVNGGAYASFTDVPYAQQPLGELRFKELQPPVPWDYLYDATKLGPICPQYDILYGPLMTNPNMSEACIHANIYVPLHALPASKYKTESGNSKKKAGQSILVLFHGGGFVSGSGDPDFYGPEYLIAEDMLIITFNYRQNIFGYLSLNTPSIPGNNALRDAVTLLRWVQSNAHYFGGNPNDVTIVGQSSGSAVAHSMVLSRAAQGLFQRAILMSGVSYRSFYTASPKHAQNIVNSLLSKLKIEATDPEKIHSRLIDTPYEELMNATFEITLENGPVSFSPVVEKTFEGITTVLDKDPECLILEGRGNEIPLLLGFTNEEGKTFLKTLINNQTMEIVKEHPPVTLSPDLVYKLSPEYALLFGKLTRNRYFKGEPTPEKYAKCFGDSAFTYPAIKLMQQRANTGAADTYLYQFAYNADFSVMKYTKDIDYDGAAHSEDIPTIFKTNSMKGVEGFEHPTSSDLEIRKYMLQTVKNFMTCNAPTCGRDVQETWPAQSPNSKAKYKNIYKPNIIFYSELTEEQEDMVRYFDLFYEYAENVCQ